ncbi:uncharacterized protein LOC142235966 [Haematobia irritans]|uniref:uncharacterized protein LOC142235966 n=1 Tax=Haematobia irritans TaxID=7368 RepID=UPI003F5057C7
MPKAYALLALIRRHSTEFQDPYVRKTLYTALVRTKLEYAQIVWSPSCSTHINRIERLQKKFVKFCLSSLNFTEPIPLYEHRCKLIHLPTLKDRRLLQCILFLYKVICGTLDCPYILSKIGFHVPSRRLRNFEVFHVPCHRTSYAMNKPITRFLTEYHYKLSELFKIYGEHMHEKWNA